MKQLTTITPEMIAKLPRWAQEHVRDLVREREAAVQALNEYCDSQTPSPIYIQEVEYVGGKKGALVLKRYIQGHRVSFAYLGIRLDVLLRDDCIDLSWGSERSHEIHVAAVPTAFQQIHLIPKDKMR